MQKSFASAHLNGRRGEYRQEKGRSVLRPEFAALRRQWMLLPEFVAACCIYATFLGDWIIVSLYGKKCCRISARPVLQGEDHAESKIHKPPEQPERRLRRVADAPQNVREVRLRQFGRQFVGNVVDPQGAQGRWPVCVVCINPPATGSRSAPGMPTERGRTHRPRPSAWRRVHPRRAHPAWSAA